MKILVVGSTGTVGSEVATSLAQRGEQVRGLVRPASAAGKVAALEAAGVETVEGDLRDPRSLAAACSGVDAVISTASAMPMSWTENNTIGIVDRDGTIALIDEAKRAGVKHFILTSFPDPQQPESPLGEAKLAAEMHLVGSGMMYTVLAANNFTEIWLSPALGFDYANGQATIYGDGTNTLSMVSFRDVVRTACKALYRSEARNTTLAVGGPHALSQREIVEIFENQSGKKWRLNHVSADALREQLESADDELQQSFAARQLAFATAPCFAMDPATYLVRTDLRSVAEYAADVLSSTVGV